MARTETRVARRGPPEAGDADVRASELPEVLQFMRLLWALVHGLQTRSKRMTQDMGITGPQRLVLRIVGLMPGITAGTLASILHVHPSTLTGVVQRLVVQKMVRSSRPDADRRVVLLSLTAKGARLNAVRRGTVEGAILDALKGVPVRETQSTQRVLGRIADRLTRDL